MTTDEYFALLKNDYDIVRVFSNKSDCFSALIRHKKSGNCVVYRSLKNPALVYDYLKIISFENLPLVYDSFCVSDGQIVFEEYIDGVTVGDVIEDGVYTYRGAKKVIFCVCDALKILHENGFVHRDVKPENIMISKDGVVKLIDFNASRRQSPSLGKDTVQIGTIGYAAPEQYGISQSDTRTDIYALGVLLNVMLTGEHPTKKLASGRAKKIVLKCTRVNPDLRFKNTDELKAEF